MGQQCSFSKGAVYSPPDSPSRGSRDTVKSLSYNYSRAQTTLRELFAAIRTGLVVSEAEFGVLPPSIATSAKVKLSLGTWSSDNQPQQSPPSTEDSAEEENNEAGEKERGEDGPYVLTTTLKGPGWAQGIWLQLSVRPVVGPFAHRKLVLKWRENSLRAEGGEQGELNPRTIPDAFEDETEFCKYCLLLAYHSDPSAGFNNRAPTEEEEVSASENGLSEGSVLPLKMAAYHTLIANLDAIPRQANLPTKVSHLLYGSQGPVDVAIRTWPERHAELFGKTPRMRVKSGILFAEFVCLLRARFRLPDSLYVQLYHNSMPVQSSDVVSEKHTVIDCFVVEVTELDLHGSFYSELDQAGTEATAVDTGFVMSLVGYKMKNITADLDMKMSDFDRLVRQSFSLEDDSFLLISSEDDYTPQYCSYDNWKCVYSFAIPDTSIRAGLRRSMRRFSLTRRRSSGSLPPRQLPQEQMNAALQPHIDRVLDLLSSNSRHFPSNLDRTEISVEQLYQTMPMYDKSLEQCNIHPLSIVQVFEVTGPSIPVTFRVISASDRDHTHTSNDFGGGEQSLTPFRTRLTNIMDINPAWPLTTFIRYVDAIVSPGSTSRRKRRLGMGEQSLENWEDEDPGMTLGQLLCQWKPAWWPLAGEERKPLTIKDVNPSEFLVVEKF